MTSSVPRSVSGQLMLFQSCGYSVPYYDFRGERTLLMEYYQKVEARGDPTTLEPRTDKGLREYWANHNTKSIDGLPGVTCALDAPDAPTNKWNREEELARSREKAAINQNVARQLKACVRAPPIIGPRAGPSNGALRNGEGGNPCNDG